EPVQLIACSVPHTSRSAQMPLTGTSLRMASGSRSPAEGEDLLENDHDAHDGRSHADRGGHRCLTPRQGDAAENERESAEGEGDQREREGQAGGDGAERQGAEPEAGGTCGPIGGGDWGGHGGHGGSFGPG